jgi:acyl-[acyl-carrier-protein]-phospholipid O-acyltransferase/long-chain-fatty-acid--[acyl-carrier-protein] ligase
VEKFLRFWLRIAHTVFFRMRVIGSTRIPDTGPALVISNHVSFVDGVLIGATTERSIRFMVWRPYYENPAFNWFLRAMHTIPVGNTGPRDMLAAIAAARAELSAGHVVGIFPEGGITRSGKTEPFKRGIERILDGLDCPVIPIYLDGLWGNIFSYSRSKLFPIRNRVTVAFGPTLPPTVTAQQAYDAIAALKHQD